MREMKKFPRSAYLHIPFCHRRCFYCDFAVEPVGDRGHGENGPASKSIKSYLDVLKREIDLSPEGVPLSTIYIGGGTPSLLSPSQVKSLLEHLKAHFGFQDGFELTLEIDPASFDKTTLDGYLKAGVNRMSLGGQSFDDKILAELGRNHRSNDLKESCIWLQEAYERGDLVSWSLDLIQNLPGHNLKLWENQLLQVIGFSIPHLSIYDLSIEPGTLFEYKFKKGQLNIPPETLAVDISNKTSLMLKEAGYSRYEISNFALPGHASRHNRVYWSGAGWWGFGQGATSAPWGKRFSRPRTHHGYKKWVEKQEMLGIHSSLKLINSQQIDLDEQLLVGLRRREGVDLEQLAISWGWNKLQRKKYLNKLISSWNQFINNGALLNDYGMRFQLTDPYGMEISNCILLEMYCWWQKLPANAISPSNSEET